AVADQAADEGADLLAGRLLHLFGVLGGQDDPAGLLGEGAPRLAEVVLTGAGAQAQPPGGDLGLVALGVDLGGDQARAGDADDVAVEQAAGADGALGDAGEVGAVEEPGGGADSGVDVAAPALVAARRRDGRVDLDGD